VSVEAMQWVLLYFSISHDRHYWEHLAEHGKNHNHALTANGTSSSGFSRSCKRKSQQWYSITWCGKTCRIAKHFQTIPVHTLMLNCCWCLHSILSAITHKLNVSGHTFTWTFFPVLVCGTRAQSLSALFTYTLYSS
jgi:hypothetical protein